MPDLEIRLLGPFRIFVDGSPVDERRWERRKPRALVKLLALQPHARLHREEIIEILWPELDLRAGANSLHKAIHAVRRTLEPDLVAGSSSRFVVTSSGLVSLVADGAVWVDAIEFERRAESALSSGDTASIADILDLYEGDLLPDDPYDEWVAPRRERLRSLRRDLLMRLAHAHESRSEYAEAARAARSILASDGTDEVAHRVLMRAQARTGDRTQALKQFRTIASALRDELGTEPDSETVELFERISRGELDPEVRAVEPAVRRDNLPAQLTTFVGKEREIADVAHLLDGSRILTLTGTGGIGKTRLSVEVARRALSSHADGVWRVELGTLTDAALVPKAVATALGVTEEPTKRIEETLFASVGARQLLVVLDNCEHLVRACGELVRAFVLACPSLRILATSREPLGVEGETVWQVSALEIPQTESNDARDAARCEAVRLFADRARQAAPRFAVTDENVNTVVSICRRLDGIPLAIELAAARVKVLSVEQILERLDDRFRLLAGSGRTALPHHRTLEATMDWSYGLLSDDERQLFEVLSVFVDGWTLDDVEGVIGRFRGIDAHVATAETGVLDTLTRVVDKSLVVVERLGTSMRYRMPETIGQYASAKLRESPLAVAARTAHRDWYLQLGERAAPRLQGPEESAMLARLDAEQANLRAALQWTIRRERNVDGALALSAALWRYWHVRSHHAEGGAWLRETLALDGGDPSMRATVLYGAGSLAIDSGEYERAARSLESCLELRRSLGDRKGIAHTLTRLGYVARCLGDNSRAMELQTEGLALCRDLGDEHGIAHAVTSLGVLAADSGDYQLAARSLEEALEIYRRLNFTRGVMISLHNLGELAQLHGDPDRAETLVEESLAISRALSDRLMTAYSTYVLGKIANDRGDALAALGRFESALAIHREIGDSTGMVYVLDGFACAYAAQGNPRKALMLAGAAAAIRESIGLTLSKTESAMLASYLEKARSTLGPVESDQVMETGRQLAIEAAVDLALETRS